MSSKPLKRKVYGRLTPNGVVPCKLRVVEPPSPPKPPTPPPPKKRKKIPKHVLDKWLDYFIAYKFTPFESVSKKKRDYQAAQPQHFKDGTTNMKWKKSRNNKVSGTKASKLTCQHDHTEFDEGLLNCIWDLFQDFMESHPEVKWRVQFGHDHEPNAAQTTLELLRSKTGQEFLAQFPTTPKSKLKNVEHKEYGFVQSIAFPFAGTSPDGIMHLEYEDGTVQRHEVEFKCKTKGYMKNAWPEDEFPQTTLYPMRHFGTKVFPIPTQYYVQIMWCILIMGKFDLSKVFDVQGHPKHFLKFKEYLEPHLHKAKTKFFGEDMVDSNVPIMFAVWAPGNIKQPHQGEPEIYKRMCFDFELGFHRSIMVKCPSGCLQLTMVDYDHEFAMKTLQYAYYVWRHHWMPRVALKKHRMLFKGEMDPPMNCFTDSETDSETEDPELSDSSSED